ncbi:MAG: hypothetical protein M3R25_09610, partial [Bacteroidota bacterium]|nr:hypothetical protein [Bacteroidota bacterium]
QSQSNKGNQVVQTKSNTQPIESGIGGLKHKIKLNRKIEQERPARRGTVFTMVSDRRTEALEGIAELLLIK